MLSMTGYGRAEALIEGRKWIIEIKSLNHRYIEVITRLPNVLSSLEVDIKKRVGERIFRGRIELSIQADAESGSDNGVQYSLNMPLLKNYYSLLMKIKEELNLKDDVTLRTLSRFKEIFVPSETRFDPAAVWGGLQKTLDEALEALIRMRQVEGEVLKKDFLARLDTLKRYLASAKLRTPRTVLEYKQRLQDRIRELTEGLEMDPVRLSQEVALLAEKSDITEEIVRFESHIGQMEKLLQGSDAIGRKLDFLLQEMGREVNTIGSKSNDVAIARDVIELKSELAKLREQAQNVE
ncbi:MAG TPA: YicC/YloC family endoribonuclease [Syntrophales bacterium]|nr:YicC/YloC family endoribonuclease [Syntrophales bacterium]